MPPLEKNLGSAPVIAWCLARWALGAPCSHGALHVGRWLAPCSHGVEHHACTVPLSCSRLRSATPNTIAKIGNYLCDELSSSSIADPPSSHFRSALDDFSFRIDSRPACLLDNKYYVDLMNWQGFSRRTRICPRTGGRGGS